MLIQGQSPNSVALRCAVSSSTTTPVTWSWHFNGNLIANANSATHDARNEGSYTCTATNSGGSATSTPGSVEIRNPNHDKSCSVVLQQNTCPVQAKMTISDSFIFHSGSISSPCFAHQSLISSVFRSECSTTVLLCLKSIFILPARKPV